MKFRPTKRYSWYVALMKILLPVGIFLTVGLGIGWPYLNSLNKELAMVDPSQPDIKENRMLRPKYLSTDKEGQPYHVDAEWAKQSGDNISDLIKPHSTMVLKEGDVFDLTAKTGKYNSQIKVLDLEGDVVLSSKEGYLVKTEKAQINIDTKIIESNSYVEGKNSEGEFKAAKGCIVESRDEGKKVITLKGLSRVIIYKEKGSQ